jgi:hypothetical protein
MKKGLALFAGLILLALLLTTTQAFADTYVPFGKPTKEDKTPGAQATERAVEKETDPPGNSEYAKTKGPDKPVGNNDPQNPGNAYGKTKEVPGNAYGKDHKTLFNGEKEHFKGTIGDVNIPETMIKVNLADGAPIELLVDEDSVIKIPTVAGDTPQVDAFNMLAVGMNVGVQAYHTNEGDLVLETLQVIPGKPTKAHRVGVVTIYKPNVSITIQGSDMGTTTYLVNEMTKILPEDRADLLEPGAIVTIIAPRDVTGGALTASGIVLHPAQ